MNGFLIVTFTDPFRALEHFKENKSNYAIVLSDYRMPGMNGMDLLKQINDKKPSVRTVLMTAFEVDNKLIHEYSRNKILNGFLQKPVRLKDLRQEINDQIHASELEISVSEP
jgi:DNA-binding NtrC family response regulator